MKNKYMNEIKKQEAFIESLQKALKSRRSLARELQMRVRIKKEKEKLLKMKSI